MMERSELANQLAKDAGQIVLSWFKKKNEVGQKGEKDIVLTADLEAEKYILSEIQSHFPADAILAEEAGELATESSVRWIVDPLDGTVNFNAGLPYFCNSIGLEEDGKMIYAAIYDPLHSQLYTAEKGRGACIDGEQVHVSENVNLQQSIISAMSRFKDEEAQKRGARDFQNILEHCRSIRIQGCSMLELCKVGQGIFDGFVKNHGAYEDFATGALFIEEASGKVTDDAGGSWGPQTQSIVCSNGILHDQLLEILNAR